MVQPACPKDTECCLARTFCLAEVCRIPGTFPYLSFLHPPVKLISRFDWYLGRSATRGSPFPQLEPMTGPLSYIGGKRTLAKRILQILPKHTTYVEAFAGGAQVFFHKEPSKVEVLNDLDGEIVNFFRVCQQHYEELIRYLKYVLVSRKWFDLLKVTDPATLTDVQRAARYLYILKGSFASLVVRPNYHWHVVQPPGFNVERLPQLIENAHKRLARVQIECLPYDQVLKRYDRPATVFYLDPPYWGRKLYRHNFETRDFEKLAENLSKIHGKFVLSLNDVPEVRTLFHRFHIRGVELSYTAQKSAGRRYREVLITNFR
jgi:DNA adenine methylase